MTKPGVLLVNLGSPASPRVGDVRRYLREFLMDPRVIDAPFPVRFFVVHGCVLPFRPRHSAEAYRKIWQPEGSPLIVTSQELQRKLLHRTDVPVQLGMRYQQPSIESAMRRLLWRGVNRLLLIPLFPHYAMSSYESAVDRVKTVLRKVAPRMPLEVVPPFFNDPGYIDALVASAEDYLRSPYDHLLFSFHGVPERHLRKTDPTGCHCLKASSCCTTPSPAHPTCYRAQCLKTTEAFVSKARVTRYSVAFQSRFGKDPWIGPHTEGELARLAARGVKRLLVICPAFVSDCLETLEEIGQRGQESFRRAGGESLELIPCLNTHPLWLDRLEQWIQEFSTKAVECAPAECASPVFTKD